MFVARLWFGWYDWWWLVSRREERRVISWETRMALDMVLCMLAKQSGLC
jgi:hypothetical protein